MTDAAENLRQVQKAIAQAAQRADRAPDDICLIAISKTFTAGQITPLLAAGHRHFGENRVQEATAKWPDLKTEYPDVSLHLVGALQSNKAEEAVALFDFIHALDRASLAVALARAMARQARRPGLFIQVNTGGESQKGGVLPDALPGLLSVARGLELPLAGLMCLPPQSEEPAPHFALLAKLAERHGLPLLSMGMSGDFEIAIQQGATHVRVGSAIFGSRDSTASHHPTVI
jgi:PLP dependent protein